MAGNGLAALMGALGGLGGLPEGTLAADKTRLAEASQAEAARHHQAQESMDVPESIATPLGMAPGKYHPGIAPLMEKLAIKRQAADQLAQDRSTLYNAIGLAANKYGTTTPGRPATDASPEAAMYSEQAPETLKTPDVPTTRTPHPALSALQGIVFGDDPKNVSTQFGETLRQIDKGQNGDVTMHFNQGPNDTFATGYNKHGDQVKPPAPLGIGAAENKGPYTRADIENLVQLEHTTPGDPNYGKLAPGSLGWRRRYNDLARTMVLPQGGNAVGAGSGLNPNNTAQVPGAAPNSLAHTPTLTSDATVAVAADGVSAARFMRQIASDLRTVAPDAQSRIALGARNVMQNLPVTRGVEFLSDQEASLATDLGHAQMRYERAMAGLRGAGSPQMYDRFSKMIGPVDKATTPAALDRLSQRMEDHISDLDMSERASGRAGFPTLLPQARQRAQAENDTRVKPQSPKWLLRNAEGVRKYYQPDAGEATPPAGWERVQ